MTFVGTFFAGRSSRAPGSPAARSCRPGPRFALACAQGGRCGQQAGGGGGAAVRIGPDVVASGLRFSTYHHNTSTGVGRRIDSAGGAGPLARTDPPEKKAPFGLRRKPGEKSSPMSGKKAGYGLDI